MVFDQPVYIYGAGRYGQLLARVLNDHGVRVAGFIDQFLQKDMMHQWPVYTLEQADKDKPVLVSIAVRENPVTKKNEIVSAVKQAGFTQIYAFDKVIRLFPQFLTQAPSLQLLWMQPETSALTLAAQIEQQKVKVHLADTLSRELFDRILHFRQSWALEDYPWPDQQLEYFPQNVPLPFDQNTVRFLDGGAYTGDTLQEVIYFCRAQQMVLDYVISFEPDEINFKKVCEVVHQLEPVFQETEFWTIQGGLWHENGILSFSAGCNSASRLEKNGNQKVPVYALDHLVHGRLPNYIKLDVEGAELNALKGAKNLIARHTPFMAICLYHKPEHLWEIPLYILSLNQNYAFYLRAHGHMGLSLVLYCVPKNTHE